MSFLKKLFGRQEVVEPPDDAYAGICCEGCFKNFEGEFGWGRECPIENSLLKNRSGKTLMARYCTDCMKGSDRCPKCGSPTMPIGGTPGFQELHGMPR